MGQYGFLRLESICSFKAYLTMIMDNFYVSILSLKSILSFNLMQFENEKEEQK